MPHPATPGADPRLGPLYRKITWRLLPFLLLCYVFAYLDRINIGFAKLQMQQDIGISDAVYGLGAGIFFLGYVMFEVPSNLLLARIGARRTISRIMVLWGLTSASMLFVQGEWSFYVLRFMLGVFEAGFAPGMIFYLTYWYSQSRMAGVMAVVMLAGPIGGIVGGPVSAWIMTAFSGAHGLDGWQWMFLLEGLPCVLIGIVAYRYLDDKPAQASGSAPRKGAAGRRPGRALGPAEARLPPGAARPRHLRHGADLLLPDLRHLCGQLLAAHAARWPA